MNVNLEIQTHKYINNNKDSNNNNKSNSKKKCRWLQNSKVIRLPKIYQVELQFEFSVFLNSNFEGFIVCVGKGVTLA